MAEEYYRVQHWSQYCRPKCLLGSGDYNTIEEANKEYNRLVRLGYVAELSKITIIK